MWKGLLNGGSRRVERKLDFADCFLENPKVFEEIPGNCLACAATDWIQQIPLPHVARWCFDPEKALSLKHSKQSQQDAHAACNRDCAAHRCHALANGDAKADRNHDFQNNARDSGKPPQHTKLNRPTRKASPKRTSRRQSPRMLG